MFSYQFSRDGILTVDILALAITHHGETLSTVLKNPYALRAFGRSGYLFERKFRE
jgi:hypothetical protein